MGWRQHTIFQGYFLYFSDVFIKFTIKKNGTEEVWKFYCKLFFSNAKLAHQKSFHFQTIYFQFSTLFPITVNTTFRFLHTGKIVFTFFFLSVISRAFCSHLGHSAVYCFRVRYTCIGRRLAYCLCRWRLTPCCRCGGTICPFCLQQSEFLQSSALLCCLVH